MDIQMDIPFPLQHCFPIHILRIGKLLFTRTMAQAY